MTYVKSRIKFNTFNTFNNVEIDKVYLGDCLELMKEIPDKNIDCIICDLLFGTTAYNKEQRTKMGFFEIVDNQ